MAVNPFLTSVSIIMSIIQENPPRRNGAGKIQGEKVYLVFPYWIYYDMRVGRQALPVAPPVQQRTEEQEVIVCLIMRCS